MNGRLLFQSRLKADYRYQLRVLKLVIDWTVALYIILPAAAIAVYQYVKWLNGGGFPHDEWLARFVLLIPAVFALLGSVRTFLMEADQLYLLQNKTAVFEMKLNGFIYCLLLQLCKWLFMMAIFSPILLHLFDMELYACGAVFFFYFSVNLFIIALKKRQIKWLHRLKYQMFHAGRVSLVMICACAAVLSSSFYIMAIIGLLLAAAALKIIIDSLSNMTLFYEEVDFENQQKLKLAKLVLSLNQDGSLPKAGKTMRAKKPRLFFTKSQKLFKTRTVQNGYREVFFKVMVRHPDYKRQLFQMIGIFTALIILGPVWLKAAALLIFVFAYRHLAGIQFDKVMERTVLLGADHESTAFYEARRSSINWIFYPGMLWCCLNLAVSLLLKTPSL
ncbi:ABC transporter permease [Bacillus swezeyi]|uniref:ABC transporter permease n=1 Tax=Bacillus swezeyi TaxID=1925020 RepID=UPI002E211CF2|nr:ABC transporter permease [Bacillus swezeyi]